MSGDRVFQPGAQPALGIQWCSEVVSANAARQGVYGGFELHCAGQRSARDQRDKRPANLGFPITFMATVEAKNKGFGALVMNITDELLLMGANGTNVEQDFTATPGFNPETVTLDGDNIPAHDPMLVTVWVYNGTKQNWQLQMRRPAPGSFGRRKGQYAGDQNVEQLSWPYAQMAGDVRGAARPADSHPAHAGANTAFRIRTLT